MKFDVGRAVALASSWDEDRRPGSGAEHRAAERVAEEFERAGLVVRREQVVRPGEPEPASITVGVGAILAGGLLWLTAWANRFLLGTDPYTLAIGFGGLALLALLERRLRTSHWGVPDVAVPIVRAETRSAGELAPVRIVVSASLASRRTRLARWLAGAVAVAEAVWLAVLLLPCFVVGAWVWLGKAGPGLMAALGALTLLGRLGRRTAPPAADNRTGLALLVELARCWPSSARDPVRVCFLATGAPRVRPDFGPRALVVELDAPGLGDRLVLAGRGRSLAARAARDLWLPFRVAGGLPTSGLRLASPTEDGPVNPALLAAAAQLVLEVALRWSREQDGSLIADRPASPNFPPTTST